MIVKQTTIYCVHNPGPRQYCQNTGKQELTPRHSTAYPQIIPTASHLHDYDKRLILYPTRGIDTICCVTVRQYMSTQPIENKEKYRVEVKGLT